MDKIIQVAPKSVLLTRDNIDEQSGWLCRIPGSREWLIEQSTDVLNALSSWGCKLVTGEGELIQITAGHFDDVHSEASDGEWISAQRRRNKAKRAPRKTLLSRLQIYSGIGIASGRAVNKDRRRADAAEVRDLLQRFNRVWQARYRHEMRKLRKAYDGKSALKFGADVRRLRLRFKAELDHWEAQR